jgi:hypothetical protein
MLLTLTISAAVLATPQFENVTSRVGLEPVRFASGALPSTAASAWVDLDDDGDIDLLLGGDELGMQAWLNTGAPEWRFEDASAAFGVDSINGVFSINCIVSDGKPQMWVTRDPMNGEAPELQLWDIPAGDAPLKRIRWILPYHLAHGDLDGDGDHDLIASAAVNCVPFSREVTGLYAWDQHFSMWHPRVDTDWPAKACLAVPAVSDYGGNGTPDVIYTSDYGLQHTPTSVILADGGIDSSLPRVYGMGVGVGDLDGDLISDYVFTSIRDDALWLSANGWKRGDLPTGGGFGETGLRVKWGSALFDADNDSTLDIYIAAGHLLSSPIYANAPNQKSLFYSGDSEVSDASGLASDSRDTTVGVADYDQDGRLDLLIGATNDWHLFRNVSTKANYLQIAIDDEPGTTAIATCADALIHAEYSGARAGAQDEPLLHFGFDDCDELIDVTVRWPWGGTSVRTGLEPNQRIQLRRFAPVQLVPRVLPLGNSFRITYRGPGTQVTWNDQLLSKEEDDEWTGVFTTTQSGDERIQLFVDGKPLEYTPWIRVQDPTFIRWSVDPTPLRRGTEHTLAVETDPSIGKISISTTGVTVEPDRVIPGTWLGRVVVPLDQDTVTLQAVIGNTLIGEPWTVSTVSAIDPLRTEVRVDRTSSDAGRVTILPRDNYGGYYVVPAERISVETSDGQTFNVAKSGFIEWEVVVPLTGHVSIKIDDIALPKIDLDRLKAPRNIDAVQSLLFPIFERARPDGDDLIVLAFRPLDDLGQPVDILSEPELVTEGLEWLTSAEPYCQAIPNEPSCEPKAPYGRWRLENLDGTPFLVTRLRALPGAQKGRAYLASAPALEAVVDLHETPRATATNQSTAYWNSELGWLSIEPRDASGHLLGSGVDITVETVPPSDAPVVYVGFGQYVRPGAFHQATVSFDSAPTTPRIEVSGTLPADSSSGCASLTMPRDSNAHWPILIVTCLFTIAILRTHQFGT